MKKILIMALSLFNLISVYSQNNVEELNLSFEKIEQRDSIWHKPISWSVLKPSVRGEIVADSYEGNWAVKIWTWYTYISGKFYIGNNGQGISFSFRPLSLNGYYKYLWGDNRGNKDFAEVYLYLTKYDKINRKTDIIGQGYQLLDSATNFTLFKMPIIYNKLVDPDTLAIQFYSHKKITTYNSSGVPLSGWCNSGINNCLYLTIDALSFDFATPTEDIKNLKSPITIHPNPTSNSIQIDWGENSVSDIVLKNTLGRIIQKKAVNTERVNLDLSSLPIGLYFIEFNQNGKHLATRKVVKQ